MPISSEDYEKAVWQSYGPPRSVDGVEANGYTIEPGTNLSSTDLYGANRNWIRGKIGLEAVCSPVGGLITHLSD